MGCSAQVVEKERELNSVRTASRTDGRQRNVHIRSSSILLRSCDNVGSLTDKHEATGVPGMSNFELLDFLHRKGSGHLDHSPSDCTCPTSHRVQERSGKEIISGTSQCVHGIVASCKKAPDGQNLPCWLPDVHVCLLAWEPGSQCCSMLLQD